jgi:predicted Zn-dependent peptidase
MKEKLFFLLAVFMTFSCGRNKVEERYTIPVDYYELDNGLHVVLSKDTTAPVVTVAVYYNIGFRIEPKERTGFAHLFEHMMFQSSENLPKGEFDKLITNNGGFNNGSTRFDFTNYYEVIPSHILEPVLWAEADRMGKLSITPENLANQQGVVVNEINGVLYNQPYGGFPWLDMPQYANENWYNAHNFYGDIEDVKAATVDEVKKFFDTYYAPDNAVLVVTGYFEQEQVKEWIEKYFGPIKAGNKPEEPDLTEPRQQKEKFASREDKLATQPALAFAYHMPERNTPEYYAMGLIDQILLQGENSMLFRALVKNKGFTGSVDGGINLLGNMFNYSGPMLWTAYLFHDSSTPSETIMQAVDSVVNYISENQLKKEEIDLARVKFKSAFYNSIGDLSDAGLADLLASFALFDDDPSMINSVDKNLDAVTPELIQKTANEYLRNTNRTVLTIIPGKQAKQGTNK